jgi:plastocyanin
MPGLPRATSALAAGALLLVLTACSSAAEQGAASTSAATPSASTPSASAPPSATASASATPAADRTIEISVRGKQVTPAPGRVEIRSGQTLRLVVTTDHDDELHAHGYDVERELVAGQPTTVDLTGAPPGLYAVETHHPELSLLQVAVRP